MSNLNKPDWKEKYLSALEEFESSQKKDMARMDILRRGLVRVSLAADGLDETLDQQLDELRSALREGVDAASLEPVVAQLEHTIVTLDDRRKDEHSNVHTLLDEQLSKYLEVGLSSKDKNHIKKLRKQLPSLLSGNGMNPEIWASLNETQDRVIQHFLSRIEALNSGKTGFFSRLFSLDRADDKKALPSIEPLDEAEISDAHTPESRIVTIAPNSDDIELAHRLSRTLTQLLENLEVPSHQSSRKANLIKRIQLPFELTHVPEFLDEAADLVASTRLLAQKEFEGFLVALHERLQDIQQFLVTARQGEELAHENQEKLDQSVRQELQDMRAKVESHSDIGQLKLDIEGMVERIVSVVDSFHDEEKSRREEVYSKIESLSHRMESMESEATQLKSNLETQRVAALRDALTEMPNRAAYNEQIENEYSRWKRHGHSLSLAVIDIDHFKTVNDTLGHLRGDKVLKLVAREISRRVRKEDFVSRYGGEEFVVIMPETSLMAAQQAMEKIRSAIEECPFNFNQQRIPITASFGIACYRDGDAMEACFERADKALYRSKENGRNQISLDQ